VTIIAATLQEMAGDRLIEWDENPPFYTPKIGRIGNSIYGICGNPEDAGRFLEWIGSQRKKERPNFEEDSFDVLQLNSEGLWLWNKEGVPIRVAENCYAIGPSAMLAIHHMRTGKSPKRAVELVLRAEKRAVGPVDVLLLNP